MTSVREQVQELANKFAQKELLPRVEEDEKTETFRPELIKQFGQLGLAGVPISEEFGGAGLGYFEYVRVIEELAAANSTYAISVAVSGLPQIIISQFGNQTQKEKYIPPLASGQVIGAFSLSEPGAGSDVTSLRTTAKKVGREYILNGTKLWTTQADVAETIVIMARTSDDETKGISSFILEKNTPGFRCGKREEKMGLHGSHTMEVVLEDCRIPEENLIGNEGDGMKIALTALNGGRVTIGACALGISREAMRFAVSHAQEREQFGRPIGTFQGISFMIADMKTQHEAARLLVDHAATLRDHQKPFQAEAAMAKLFATDMAMKVTTDCVQILGGSGYTKEFPVERYMREAKVMQIVEGTNQIQRMVIARSVTGLRS